MLSGDQVYRFYRRELTERGYTATLYDRQATFSNGAQFITVSWRDPGRFIVTRNDWRKDGVGGP